MAATRVIPETRLACPILFSVRLYSPRSLGTSIKIIKFKGSAEKFQPGVVMEIRGIVNKDQTISFGEYTQYDNEFDLATFESMLGYYHGMCRDLCIR